MASSFAFHPTVNEVVPYFANYKFPDQATRQSKRTIKITPKNNATSFNSGSIIRFEFPASGYLNPNNTYMAFNVALRIQAGTFLQATNTGGTVSAQSPFGFEIANNIASIFRRVRVLYGSLVIEDIQDYNILQRMFTEITTPSGTQESSNTIYSGLGPSKYQLPPNSLTNPTTPFPMDYQTQRFNYHATGNENAEVNIGTTVRRYVMPINTGLFQQHNLLPLKFMANQLQVELEIADPADCAIMWTGNITATGGVTQNGSIPTSAVIQVGLPELITELLEFDSEFDAAVYDILGTGLPIYFQSWHMTTQTVSVSLINQLNIQETARSVRYCLAAMLDDANRTYTADYHVFYPGLATRRYGPWLTTNSINFYCESDVGCLLESYQWRLGGTYYPSQPVPCQLGQQGATLTTVDANYADPPVEAYMELVKVFGNMFADDGTYFNDNFVNIFGYGRRGVWTPQSGGTPNTIIPSSASSNAVVAKSFIIAGNFMSDRGDVISGINAEEQNDLQITLKFVGTSPAYNAAGSPGGASIVAPKTLKIATCYDNLIILGENNNMVLVN